MRIALTGASSGIGRAVRTQAELRGIQAVSAPSSKQLNVLDGPRPFTEWLAQVQIDALIHIAGAGAGSGFADAFAVNVGGTFSVLEALKSVAPKAALVIASSAAVYGQQPFGVPIRPEAVRDPVNAYGAAKAAQEDLAMLLGQNSELSVCVARIFNVVGAGMIKSAVLPDLIGRILAAKDGADVDVAASDCVRDFIHEDDVASALLALAASRGTGAVNVCTGTGTSIRQLAQLVAHACAKDVRLRYLSSGRTDVIRWSVGENAALRSIGWCPREALADTVTQVRRAIEESARS